MGWRCEGLVDSAQRSSALFAMCGGINLCRGSPHREAFEGGLLVFLELSVPQPEGLSVGIVGLFYDSRRPSVASKVELDHPYLVLMRMHPMSFPVPNQHGILSASPSAQ